MTRNYSSSPPNIVRSWEKKMQVNCFLLLLQLSAQQCGPVDN